MAGSSFFMLIDDIATLLDDVAVLSKVAVTKTAGVLGDDLALNAQQVSGVNPERELPVVWAVAKGSMLNKVILVPSALALNAVLPAAVTPLLMAGGAYLCFEGVEKLAHSYLHTKQEDESHHQAHLAAVDDESVDLVAFEKDKISGAIRTDFILSAEIIVIALSTVKAESFLYQVLVLCAVAIFLTITVYGLVAGIVKMDDLGLYWARSKFAFKRKIGALLLIAAPKLMKFLSVAGTLAMFLVGGAIIVHGWPTLHHALESVEQQASAVTSVGALLKLPAGMMFELVIGVLTGAVCLAVVMLAKRTFRRRAA
jgi:uncharacterized protein